MALNSTMKIDLDKVVAVLEMTTPTDVEAVQQLHGFENYLVKFLPNIADYMGPICKLIRKDTAREWSQQQENAFQEVKYLVTVAPASSYQYDQEGELEVQCDARNKGLGAALLKPIRSNIMLQLKKRY